MVAAVVRVVIDGGGGQPSGAAAATKQAGCWKGGDPNQAECPKPVMSRLWVRKPYCQRLS